jgi:hypothetical protein
MNKLDYSRGLPDNPQTLNLAQSLSVTASVVFAVVLAFVVLVFPLNNTILLICYVLFLLSDTALAIMLLCWRRRFDWALLVVGWIWVSLGFWTLFIVIGENSGLIRE